VTAMATSSEAAIATVISLVFTIRALDVHPDPFR
jgi:hypothetical protein